MFQRPTPKTLSDYQNMNLADSASEKTGSRRVSEDFTILQPQTLTCSELSVLGQMLNPLQVNHFTLSLICSQQQTLKTTSVKTSRHQPCWTWEDTDGPATVLLVPPTGCRAHYKHSDGLCVLSEQGQVHPLESREEIRTFTDEQWIWTFVLYKWTFWSISATGGGQTVSYRQCTVHLHFIKYVWRWWHLHWWGFFVLADIW